MDPRLKNTLAALYALTGLHIFVYDRSLAPVCGFGAPATPEALEDFLSTEPETSEDGIGRTLLDKAVGVFVYTVQMPDFRLFLGPVAHHTLTPWEIHRYAGSHRRTADCLIACQERSVYAALSLLSCSPDRTVLSPADLEKRFSPSLSPASADQSFMEQQLSQIDTFQLSHSGRAEAAFFELVRQGDAAGLERLLDSTTLLYPSPVQNRKKNTEYMAVSLISLLCRAAMSAGVPSSIAMTQSDACLKILSECKTEDEMSATARDAAVTFTRLAAKEQATAGCSYVSVQCRKKIHAGLFRPLTLSSLAEELSVSKEYLAACFKKDFGVTVTHYIHQKKTELARKILADSDYSINAVADLLCYRSTSYFIKVFKTYTGLSPGAYRRQPS